MLTENESPFLSFFPGRSDEWNGSQDKEVTSPIVKACSLVAQAVSGANSRWPNTMVPTKSSAALSRAPNRIPDTESL